jgi:hypothetical protein
VQHNFLSHRGYKISDDILLVPLARNNKDPVRGVKIRQAGKRQLAGHHPPTRLTD